MTPKNTTSGKDNPAMRVSVAITTYNHENFIADALDGVLKQEVDFPYELVVGDDASTDRTRDILRSYREKYPDKVRLLLHEKNLGYRGAKNLSEVLDACYGEYVAVLDGDDYWTAPDKLKRQVQFLDDSPQCSICFHSLERLDSSAVRSIAQPAVKKEIYTLSDLLIMNFIPKSSTLFRRALFPGYPSWAYGDIVGDWVVHVLLAEKGDIGYIDEVMGTYRKHSEGVSSDSIHMLSWATETSKRIDAYLDYRYHHITRRRIAGYYLQLAKQWGELRDGRQARKYWMKSIAASPFRTPLSTSRPGFSLKEWVMATLYAYFPGLATMYYRAKKSMRLL